MIQRAIGADIGGSHISAAVVDLSTGQLLPETLFRKSYEHQQSADDLLHAWAVVLRQSLDAAGTECQGMGIAMPGPFDYQHGISKMKHKFPHLFNYDVRAALSERLGTGSMPIRFLNDATSFAVGEAWVGAGKSVPRVVVVTLGTGFGSAFLQDGIPIVHSEEVPKEGCMWHLPFKEGIADDYFSTRWLVAAYEAASGLRLPGVQQMVERAENDPYVQAIFEEFGSNLARCLEAPLRRFRADQLIMGGNIAHAWPLFQPSFERGLAAMGYYISVTPSKLWEQGALIGSARLMDPIFWEKVSADFPVL